MSTWGSRACQGQVVFSVAVHDFHVGKERLKCYAFSCNYDHKLKGNSQGHVKVILSVYTGN